jgi:hypothetical protein
MSFTPLQSTVTGNVEMPPASATLAEKLYFALRYAILAPSSHNTQPWRFIVGDDYVLVCADRLRALPIVDPYDRELTISCGAALFNLRVALSRLGLAYAITLFPSSADPDLLARVHLLEEGHCDPGLPALFDAIAARVTTRMPFTDAPVPVEVERAMIDAGEAEGVEVVCVGAQAKRERIADLISVADRQQFADSRFRRELASWIHPRRCNDGMLGYASGLPTLLDFAAPVLASAVRTFDMGAGVAATHQRLVAGSPLLVALATRIDEREAWLTAGGALERVLLVAARAGLTASYLNQPVEVESLRPQLATLLAPASASVTQLLLRVGYGPAVPHAPRRPLSDVVS